MTVAVGDYSLCDGTLAGGVAVSDLRVNQRRISDVVPVLPKTYRISLINPGFLYSVNDELTISASGSASIQVVLIGSGGEILNFIVLSNTFSHEASSLLATGGTGNSGTFNVLSSSQPNAISPTIYDRRGRPCVYDFTVKRTHPSVDDAEQFLIGLEDSIPSFGDIDVTTTGPASSSFSIPNGKVQSHSLVLQQGATTFHQYSIIGGPPTSV